MVIAGASDRPGAFFAGSQRPLRVETYARSRGHLGLGRSMAASRRGFRAGDAAAGRESGQRVCRDEAAVGICGRFAGTALYLSAANLADGRPSFSRPDNRP
jgi:hypothetical protein